MNRLELYIKQGQLHLIKNLPTTVLEKKNEQGYTSLDLAILYNKFSIVKWLIDNNNIFFISLLDPFYLAIEKERIQIAQYIGLNTGLYFFKTLIFQEYLQNKSWKNLFIHCLEQNQVKFAKKNIFPKMKDHPLNEKDLFHIFLYLPIKKSIRKWFLQKIEDYDVQNKYVFLLLSIQNGIFHLVKKYWMPKDNCYKLTPLKVAIQAYERSDNKSIFKDIIYFIFSQNYNFDNEINPLYWFLRQNKENNIDEFKSIFYGKQANVQPRDFLCIPDHKCDLDFLDFLLRKGLNPYQNDFFGMSPFLLVGRSRTFHIFYKLASFDHPSYIFKDVMYQRNFLLNDLVQNDYARCHYRDAIEDLLLPQIPKYRLNQDLFSNIVIYYILSRRQFIDYIEPRIILKFKDNGLIFNLDGILVNPYSIKKLMNDFNYSILTISSFL